MDSENKKGHSETDEAAVTKLSMGQPRTAALIREQVALDQRGAYMENAERQATATLALCATLETELTEARKVLSDVQRELGEQKTRAAKAVINAHAKYERRMRAELAERDAYAGALLERAERMRQHILTKVVGRLCEPSGRVTGEWGCGMCGGVGVGPRDGTRDLETIKHESDCMLNPLGVKPDSAHYSEHRQGHGQPSFAADMAGPDGKPLSPRPSWHCQKCERDWWLEAHDEGCCPNCEPLGVGGSQP